MVLCLRREQYCRCVTILLAAGLDNFEPAGQWVWITRLSGLDGGHFQFCAMISRESRPIWCRTERRTPQCCHFADKSEIDLATPLATPKWYTRPILWLCTHHIFWTIISYWLLFGSFTIIILAIFMYDNTMIYAVLNCIARVINHRQLNV